MTCKNVIKHCNSINLNIYTFHYSNNEVQIICNKTNIYEVGDKAIIVLAPSILKDNTNIRESRIRGELSQGMALGKSSLEEGTDVSEEYCLGVDYPNRPKHISWPSIEALYNVRKYLNDYNLTRKITYRSKIKIDGTHAGVVIKTDGTFYVQSKNEIITPDCDNSGFAKWIMDNSDYFSILNKTNTTLVLFGEWAGGGIMKGVAISQIGRKIFCPFAIQYEGDKGSWLEINPLQISEFLPYHKDIFVLPWHGKSITLNYSDHDGLLKQAEVINEMVAEVEKEDPFVKENFQISGVGEGVVCFPMPDNAEIDKSILISRKDFTDLVFKAKGKEHKVVKNKASVQIDPTVAKSIGEFVELFCTETRLNQIAEQVGLFDNKSTGKFLKAFNQDVLKESVAELEAANMSWENVYKAVGACASKWWINNCNKL